MKKFLTIFVTLIVLAFAVVLSYTASKNSQKSATSFEECAAQGNPVMESYPPRCISNGKSFTQDIGNELEKSDLIKIETPRPTSTVSSPLEVRGKARGTWFFEASFPIYLYDDEGSKIASGVAQAQSNWMTEEYVPFVAILEFRDPDTNVGELVLEKSNPSGLSENSDRLIVPVEFF